jgi:hypothetical protein
MGLQQRLEACNSVCGGGCGFVCCARLAADRQVARLSGQGLGSSREHSSTKAPRAVIQDSHPRLLWQAFLAAAAS